MRTISNASVYRALRDDESKNKTTLCGSYGNHAYALIWALILLLGLERVGLAAASVTIEGYLTELPHKLKEVDPNPEIPRAIFEDLSELVMVNFRTGWSGSTRSDYWYSILPDANTKTGEGMYVRMKPRIKMTISKLAVESYRSEAQISGRLERSSKLEFDRAGRKIKILSPLERFEQKANVQLENAFSFDKPTTFLHMEVSTGLSGNLRIDKKSITGTPLPDNVIELIELQKTSEQMGQTSDWQSEPESEHTINAPKEMKTVTKVLHGFKEEDYKTAYSAAWNQVAKYWMVDVTNSRLYGVYGSGQGARMKRVDNISTRLDLVLLPKPVEENKWNKFTAFVGKVGFNVYTNPQSILELATEEHLTKLAGYEPSMQLRAIFTVYGDLVDFISSPPRFEPLQVVQTVELVRDGAAWRALVENQQYPGDPGTVPAKRADLTTKWDVDVKESVIAFFKEKATPSDEYSPKQYEAHLKDTAKRATFQLLSSRYAAIGSKNPFLGPDFYGALPHTNTPAVVKLDHVECFLSVFMHEGQLACKFKVVANIINTWEPAIHLNEAVLMGTLWWDRTEEGWSEVRRGGKTSVEANRIEHFALRAAPLKRTLKEVQDLYW